MPKAFTTRWPRTTSATKLARSAMRSWMRWLVRRMLRPKRTMGNSSSGAAIRHSSARWTWMENRNQSSTASTSGCCTRSSSWFEMAPWITCRSETTRLTSSPEGCWA